MSNRQHVRVGKCTYLHFTGSFLQAQCRYDLLQGRENLNERIKRRVRLSIHKHQTERSSHEVDLRLFGNFADQKVWQRASLGRDRCRLEGNTKLWQIVGNVTGEREGSHTTNAWAWVQVEHSRSQEIESFGYQSLRKRLVLHVSNASSMNDSPG
jgi:hypothetical protein